MMSTKDFTKKQIAFVFLERGEKISFRNDNLVIWDKDGKIKHQSSCYLLFALFIAGHLCITDGLILRARKFGFSLVLMTPTFRVYATIMAKAEGNVLLRRQQYENMSFDFGAWVISNKIKNQCAVLKHIRYKDEALKMAIENLKLYQSRVLQKGLAVDEIMGLEGVAAKVYFCQLFRHHQWLARRPRVKEDITNCLLDIGYTLLFQIVDALLEMYGFDCYVGILHREFYHRKSLVCDLMEPFRPVIDKAIYTALNRGECCSKDFSQIQNQYFISGKKAVPYLQFLMEAILNVKDEIFLYFQEYYRAFMRGKPANEFPIFEFGGTGVNR